MSTKTLKLSFPHPNHLARSKEELDAEPEFYRVEQVTNSVDYSPRQFLKRKEVKDLCDIGQWNVTIIPAVRS